MKPGAKKPRDSSSEDEPDLTATLAKLADAHAAITMAETRSGKRNGELAHGWHRNLDAHELDRYTRATLNATLLIRHLRRLARDPDAAQVSPELLTLIADVLEGKCKAKKKRFTAFDSDYLRATIATAKELLHKRDDASIKTKGELSKDALQLVAGHVGLTPRALKDRLMPSAKRGKRG